MGEADQLISAAIDAAVDSLSQPGDWLTGSQRRAAALEARDARVNELDQARREAISPHAVPGSHPATHELSAEAVEVVHRVSSDPGRLSHAWAKEMMAELGEEVYTELVGISAKIAVVDMFAFALARPEPALDTPTQGEPACVRPDGVGAVGAWVSQTMNLQSANVSRSLSLVPVTDAAWRGLVQATYSRGAQFLDLTWDRALSRPQVELVAARTTAELECFY